MSDSEDLSLSLPALESGGTDHATTGLMHSLVDGGPIAEREDLQAYPEVNEPLMPPPTLEALLADLRRAREDGNLIALADCARDALGFTTRYFAGVLSAACRQLDCLPAQLINSEGTSNVEESARQLRLCLERLQKSNERLAKKLSQIFLEDQGGYRRFAQSLAPGENGEFTIVSFCRAPRNERPSPEDLTQALRWLDQWMNSCFGFFLESEQRFDSGPFFGQVEQVVIFEQYTLPTGLTLRLKETRQPAPDSTSLVLESDKSPTAEIPVLDPIDTPEPQSRKRSSKKTKVRLKKEHANRNISDEPTLILKQSDLFPEISEEPTLVLQQKDLILEVEAEIAPQAEAEPPMPSIALGAPAAEKVPGEAGALVDFLQLKLNQNPVKPHPEKVAAPEGYLDCEIDQAGLRKNLEGKFGYAGYLWVQLRGEDETEIEGTATCENPRVQLSPATFKGVQSRIVYWVDPDEMRLPKGHVLFKAHGQSRQIPVWKLLPDSALANFSPTQILALLFLPGFLGTLYTAWVLWATGARIDTTLHDLLRQEFSHFMNFHNPVSLRAGGIGFVDLRLLPQIEAALLLFFCLSWLAPLGAAMVFNRLPRHEKQNYGLAYATAMVLPSLLYMLLWPTALTRGVVFVHPDFQNLDFRRHLSDFFLMNLVSAVVAQLWTGGFLDRHLNNLGRFVLALVALLSFAAVTMALVYGRSWLGSF